MKSAEHKVTGFGRGDSGFDRVDITHLTDEYDIWILTQTSAQTSGKTLGILPHLTLIDSAEDRFIHILYRVLKGHDMGTPGKVDLVDKRSERGGFTTARLTGHKHDALVKLGELHDNRRKPQRVKFGDIFAQKTQRDRGNTLLLEDMDTASVADEGIRGVQFSDFLIIRIIRAGKLLCVGKAVCFAQRLICHILQLTVMSILRRQAADKVNVGRMIGLCLCYQLIDCKHDSPPWAFSLHG